MSCAWRISITSCNSAALLNQSSLKEVGTAIVFSPNAFSRWKRQMGCSVNCRHQNRLSFVDNQDNVKESSDMRSIEQADSTGKVNHHEESLTTRGITHITALRAFKRLKRYGISGVLSYGLLNTAYYLSTFLFVWLYIVPVPGRMGYLGAVERFLKVLAMVWAGSQVTKLIRAGVALALAPAVDKGLSWFTVKFKFESQEKAFMAIAGLCFGLAFLVFLVLTLLWA